MHLYSFTYTYHLFSFLVICDNNRISPNHIMCSSHIHSHTHSMCSFTYSFAYTHSSIHLRILLSFVIFFWLYVIITIYHLTTLRVHYILPFMFTFLFQFVFIFMFHEHINTLFHFLHFPCFMPITYGTSYSCEV